MFSFFKKKRPPEAPAAPPHEAALPPPPSPSPPAMPDERAVPAFLRNLPPAPGAPSASTPALEPVETPAFAPAPVPAVPPAPMEAPAIAGAHVHTTSAELTQDLPDALASAALAPFVDTPSAEEPEPEREREPLPSPAPTTGVPAAPHETGVLPDHGAGMPSAVDGIAPAPAPALSPIASGQPAPIARHPVAVPTSLVERAEPANSAPVPADGDDADASIGRASSAPPPTGAFATSQGTPGTANPALASIPSAVQVSVPSGPILPLVPVARMPLPAAARATSPVVPVAAPAPKPATSGPGSAGTDAPVVARTPLAPGEVPAFLRDLPPAPPPPPAPSKYRAEPEAPEIIWHDRRDWVDKLSDRLKKTGGGLKTVLVNRQIDEELYEELEDALLMTDAGVPATEHLMGDVRRRVRDTMATDASQVRTLLADALTDLLKPLQKELVIGEFTPTIIMVAGVNGAGKTTSIGKLTKHLSNEGCATLLAAADTFRAAAREQLAVWADRNLVEIVSQEGGDPSAVAFDAVKAGKARGKDVVLVDTAGRLPTQTHLMEELKKIKRVVNKADNTGPHELILVVDGNTGQNAVAQVKAFDDALGLTGLIVTKLDGTARGGVLAAIARERPIPVYFVGVGEKLEDLETFSAREYAKALLG